MPLKDSLSKQSTVADLLEAAWETSTQNAVARGYMAGMIDTLMWCSHLTEQEYADAYERYVYGAAAAQANRANSI